MRNVRGLVTRLGLQTLVYSRTLAPLTVDLTVESTCDDRAFEVVKGEAMRYERGDYGTSIRRASTLSPPIQARLQAEINHIGISIKRLFAYRYQVLPYIYTHLVSLSCALYLICFAFLMGTRFSMDASIAFGLVYPLLYVTVQIVTTFGLIEVGETILDPFGSDPEDYALLHFVEVTVVPSRFATNVMS